MRQIIVLLIGVVVIANGMPDGQVKGTKRDTDPANPLQDAEQAAGKAVLKLLDAKIGRKVQDAAKEVTDFLTSAIGSHATTRADSIREDKQKEMSLLHLGAMSTIKQHVKKHQDKPKLKKKKDGSFLVHFKIPYIVTPIKKKKPHHHHHHHKHWHHHHPHHHSYHPKHKTSFDKPPPIEVPSRPYHPAYHPGTQAPSPYTTSTTGYTQDYTSASTQAATMAPVTTAATGPFSPCQGMCNAPCTPQCTPATDCCCCPNPHAAIPPAAVPVPPATPMLPPPNPNQPPLSPEQFMQLPLLPGSPLPPGACPQVCKRHCIARCPDACCGAERKRDNVVKPAKKTKEDKPEKVEKAKQTIAQEKAEDEKKAEPKSADTQEDQQIKTIEDEQDEGSTIEASSDDDENV